MHAFHKVLHALGLHQHKASAAKKTTTRKAAKPAKKTVRKTVKKATKKTVRKVAKRKRK